MGASLILAMILVATSALAVLAALLLAWAWQGWHRAQDTPVAPPVAIFLVARGVVLDANRCGSALLDSLQHRDLGAQGEDGGRNAPAVLWDRLIGYLLPVFPDLSLCIDRMQAEGGQSQTEIMLEAADGSGRRLNVAARAGGSVHLCLHQRQAAGDDAAGGDAVLVDRLSWQALRDENALLQRHVDLSPVPVWRHDAAGRIVWANAAYMCLLREVGGVQLVRWPLPALFAPVSVGSKPRQAVQTRQRGRQLWFDLVACADGEDTLVHALPADEAQKAERTRREFVQTLTRTFSTLPIGLAVFDRTRRLHLFNPALTDLTRLEPEFLASRPGVDGFLNRMRDKRILPEPRDYKAWSRRLLDVETAATSGGFEETWSLADGRSFRVSVAPHPDGALAFLIEDITDDMRMKRSFRAELDIGQAALDMVDSAVAVFSPGGELILTNAAFDDLWPMDSSDTLAGVRLSEVVATWRPMSDDPALWDRVASLSRAGGAMTETWGRMCLRDGKTLDVHAAVSPTGGLMLSFDGVGPAARRRPPRLAERLRHRAMA